MDDKIKKYNSSLFDWFNTPGKGRDQLEKQWQKEGIFHTRSAAHMLAGEERDEAFDDEDYMFEPAFGGLRAFAYLAPDECTLTGRHGTQLLTWFPEFGVLNSQVRGRCILDGEIVNFKNGLPDCKTYGYRIMQRNPNSIMQASLRSPAMFVASDIVFSEDSDITELPLQERKKILGETVVGNKHIMCARYMQGQGNKLFKALRQRGLEGIVAKRNDSQYHFGLKNPAWITVKTFLHDNFIICGHAEHKDARHLVLGQYDPVGVILFRGTVTLGVSAADMEIARQQETTPSHPFPRMPKDVPDGVTWLAPALVCSVSFTARDDKGQLFNPTYRGLRLNKSWEETIMTEAVTGCRPDPDAPGKVAFPWL